MTLHLRVFNVAGAGIAALMLWLPVQAQTQTLGQTNMPPMQAAPAKARAEPAKTSATLAAPVHLLLGAVSVTQLTATLSEQTSLTVSAAPYLRDRRIVVQMDGVSAANALDAICEMNDWTWREVQPGEVRLSRHVLQLPHEPAYIPRFVQNALPTDLRDYLYVARPSEKLHDYRPPVTGAADVPFKLTHHLGNASAGAAHELRATLSIPELEKKPLPYTRLSAMQKTLLLTTYIYDYFHHVQNYMLLGDLPYAYIDPGSCLLTYQPKDSNFYFEARNPHRPQDGTIGFGAFLPTGNNEAAPGSAGQQ